MRKTRGVDAAYQVPFSALSPSGAERRATDQRRVKRVTMRPGHTPHTRRRPLPLEPPDPAPRPRRGRRPEAGGLGSGRRAKEGVPLPTVLVELFFRVRYIGMWPRHVLFPPHSRR